MDIIKMAGEYGVAIVAIGALIYTVRLFMLFLKEHMLVIRNHLNHHTEASVRLTDSIKELLSFLRGVNHGKK